MTWKDEVKFGPPTPKKMRTVSPTLACSGCSFDKRADRAVEDEIFRPLVQQLLDAELLAAVLPERRIGIDLALHDIELVVDRRQPALRLDQDQAVHAVGDVLGDHRRRAVIDVEAGHQRLAGHRSSRRPDRPAVAAAPPPGPVAAWKSTEWIIALSAEFFRWMSIGVADPHADERPRHLAVEGPVAERRAFGEPPFDFDA